MSRRNRNRNRPPAGVALPGQSQQQSAQPAFSRPVQCDFTKLEIPDLALFAQAEALAHLPEQEQGEATRALIPGLVGMLQRVVVGGLQGRPAYEFWSLVNEVARQMNALGNPKN